MVWIRSGLAPVPRNGHRAVCSPGSRDALRMNRSSDLLRDMPAPLKGLGYRTVGTLATLCYIRCHGA